MPILRNLIDHETAHGYRTFELWQGDITDPGFSVDILAVSYSTSPRILATSVVAALKRRYGISVHSIVEDDAAYDLRQALGVSLSHELTGSSAQATAAVPFRRFLCLEISRCNLSPNEALENVFASLALFEAKGIEAHSIAMPLFGTGGMGYSPQDILKSLLSQAKKCIERSQSLERIAFFGYNPQIADLLDESMNEILGRSRVTLSKKALITGLCSDIAEAFQTCRHHVKSKHLSLIQEFQSVLGRDTVRSFEIGILGRRVAEMILLDLLGDDKAGRVLARNIDKLRGIGVSEWIISYFDVLRLLGNESAHERNAGKSIPAFVNEGDLAVGLACIQRLWDFWIEWKATVSPKGHFWFTKLRDASYKEAIQCHLTTHGKAILSSRRAQ